MNQKQERIVKIFTGRHIDLESIISISDARIDYTTTGCPYFTITCRLLDKPIYYYRDLDWGISDHDERRDKGKENLQKQIDELIIMWKNYVSQNPQ